MTYTDLTNLDPDQFVVLDLETGRAIEPGNVVVVSVDTLEAYCNTSYSGDVVRACGEKFGQPVYYRD